MLNLGDLDKVYDPSTPTIGVQTQLSGPGDPPKPKPIPTLKDADNPTAPSPITFGNAKPVDVRDYGNQLDNGVYSDQDIDSQRGQHQSTINQLGHALGNLPGNIVGGFLEGIGDIGLLAGQWGDDRTYTNALTEAGAALHNATGEIYMNSPHSTLGATLSDPGWWISQVEGLAELGVSYAALGAGVGGTISKLAEGTAGLLRAGELGARTLQGFGQMGSAGFMSYTMGASNAAQVFKDTYNNQFQKFLDAGQDPDTASHNAKHIAAQSAATTAQLTTAIGTGLGIGAMAPFFRQADNVAMDILRKKVPQEIGEDSAAWLSRVKSLAPEDYQSLLNPSKSWSNKLLESGKMGVEMQQLQFGEKTGEDLGRKGKIKGFLDQFDELENYMDRTMDKDGALAFATGIAGGMLIHKFTNDIIPSKWADKIDRTTGQPIPKLDAEGNETGENEKRLYTPKAYSETHTALAFTKMRDAIASDIEQYNKHQQSYLAAVKAGDPVAKDRSASEMFNVNNVSGIINGMGDMWKQTYQQMGNMSPEEAQQRGFIADPNEYDGFKKKANEAASNMDRYQKIYDKLQDTYGTLYQSGQGYKPVVDGLFSRKVHLDAWDKMLKEHEEKLSDNATSENARLSISDPDLFDQHTAEYMRNWDASRKTVDKLIKDHKTIMSLVDEYNKIDSTKRNNVVQKMAVIAREYSSLDPEANNSAESLTKSMKGTTDQIEKAIERQKKRMQEHEDTLLNSTGFTAWSEKNPGKTFQDYQSKVYEQVHNSEYQHQIELSREKYKIAEQNIAQLEKEKNLNRFANKYSKYMDDELEKTSQFEKEQNRELAERAKGTKVFDQAQRAKQQEMANRYKAIRDEHLKAVKDETERLESVKNELSSMEHVKDFVRKSGLRNQQRKLEKRIAELNAKVRKYDSLYNDHKSYEPEETPVSVNNVTINPPEEPTVVTPDMVDEDFIHAEDIITSADDLADLADHEVEEVTKTIDSVQVPLEQAEQNLLEELTKHTSLDAAMDHINDAYQSIVENGDHNFGVIIDRLKIGFGISDADANALVSAMSDYAKAIENAQITGDLIGYKQGEAIIMEEDIPAPEVDTIDTNPSSDVPIFSSDDKDSKQYDVPGDSDQSAITFGGAKTVEANTIANSTLGFGELKPNTDKEINNISVQDAINKKTNPDVLRAGKLMPGTNIRFEVDVDYDGPKRITGRNVPDGHESFSDYADKNGKIPADKMGNVPIKIVDNTTGRTIGYVRKHEWITERYPDGDKKSGLRNIAEKYTDDGEEYNAATQSKKILDIRKQIVNQFNANGKHTSGSITNKGVGHAILNTEGFKSKPQYAYNNKDTGLLPDPKLQIVIVNNGSLFSGKGFQFTKPVAGETKDLPNGTIYAMLPGANGQHIPAPLVGRNLGETDAAHRTISRALELYLSYTGSEEESQTHEIRKLQDKTGHDISSESGLRNFINQYFTHTQSFQDTATIAAGKGRTQFLFNVWDKISGKESKAWIKAGWSESNQKPVYAKLDSNGKLSQDFSDLLRDGLKTRSKSVVFTREGIRGINEKIDKDNPFIDAQYNASGKWVHPTYSNYNEYVKSFSKTTVYGRNKLGGDYVYTANPAISYDMEPAAKLESPTSIVVENKTTKVNIEPIQEEKKYDKSAADEMDDIFNLQPFRQEKRDEIGSAPDKSKPLDLKSLEDLYTFTPEDQRNGKVPSDILKELTDRGHSFLPDGYNPFSLCL